MAEMVKKATRESFGEAITALAETNPDIVVLDADLAEATKTGIFKKKYPERFIDCGIAECNMIGIAAGLATCGKVPFAASFAMFSAGRAFEQVRNSVGYPHLNVKIVGSHAGISVGEDGATHQCCEDIALMRSIPGMVILNPADHYEMLAAVKAAAEHVGPVYIRLGRLAVESFNNNDDYKFEIGKGITLRDGKDITIIATGLMVGEAVKAVKALEAAGAKPQRPLWASTGVKDPALPDTLYVTELVAPGTVNTMPEATLDATADHGVVSGNTIVPNYADAKALLDAVAAAGVDYDDVVQVLEDEGVQKFEQSWQELLDTVTASLASFATEK